MKEKTCCFTGHRKIPVEDISWICDQLEKEIVKMIEHGYCYFGSGGALGFDTLAAKAVLKLKKEFPHIRLILVLPFLNQAKLWSEEDVEIYEEIKVEADKVVYTSEQYWRGCMHKRNRHLVDNSSACIAYITKESGGTFYTVKYAESKDLNIIKIK